MTPSPSHIEHELTRIRDLSNNRRHSEALAAAVALEAEAPAHPDVLYLIATNNRCLNRIPEALGALQRLEQRHPQFSLLYQERGYCYTTLRDASRAIDSFLRGVNLNPALSASWNMLERLYRMLGQPANADTAANQVSRLNIRVLLDRQKYLQASDEIDVLLRLEPANTEYVALSAAACVGLGRYERAIAIYHQLLAAIPDSAELHVSLGNVLRTVGRRKEAIECYCTAAALRPSFGDAWWSLANLKTYRFSPDEIRSIRAEEAAPGTASVDRYHLCFALGKAYEDRTEYAESWRFYERGNQLKRAAIRYDPEAIETNTRKQKEICTAEFFAARSRAGAPDPDPIFIVGLPRSGSTLIEQILASHSQVEATHELADLQRIVVELSRSQYPDAFAELTHEDFRRLGQRYLTDTRAYRRGKPFFIDKLPNNFRDIGLIHLILPNAKIIDVRREPMACCFSNWKQLFAKGQEFSYSLDDLARYYRTYLELMRHWDAVLPGRVLRVWYEDVVNDTKSSVRRILELCGLEYQPSCLEFYKTQRSIQTASSEQVRQPVFRDGLCEWQNYEPWLDSLKHGLGDALICYRD